MNNWHCDPLLLRSVYFAPQLSHHQLRLERMGNLVISVLIMFKSQLSYFSVRRRQILVLRGHSVTRKNIATYFGVSRSNLEIQESCFWQTKNSDVRSKNYFDRKCERDSSSPSSHKITGGTHNFYLLLRALSIMRKEITRAKLPRLRSFSLRHQGEQRTIRTFWAPMALRAAAK